MNLDAKQPPFKNGDEVIVLPRNLGAGGLHIVERCFKGLAGGWFADLSGGVTYAAKKLELVSR